MLIRNYSDLRIAYGFLSCLKSYPHDHEVVVDIKRNIRAYINKPKPERRIVYDDGIDGFIELRPLPDANSAEEADEIFRYYYYMESPNSWYDCTGQAFTNWYKIIERHGMYYAYHDVRFDV